MALQETYPDPFGTADLTAYIRLGEVTLNVAEQRGRIVLYVHRDADSRNAGKQPVDRITLVLNPEATDLPAFADVIGLNARAMDDLTAALYGVVKVQPILDGAADV
jgi:hypothetical protein